MTLKIFQRATGEKLINGGPWHETSGAIRKTERSQEENKDISGQWSEKDGDTLDQRVN